MLSWSTEHIRRPHPTEQRDQRGEGVSETGTPRAQIDVVQTSRDRIEATISPRTSRFRRHGSDVTVQMSRFRCHGSDVTVRRSAERTAAAPMRSILVSPNGVPPTWLRIIATRARTRVAPCSRAAEPEVTERPGQHALGGADQVVAEPPAHVEPDSGVAARPARRCVRHRSDRAPSGLGSPRPAWRPTREAGRRSRRASPADPYIRASERAVNTPLAAGISPSWMRSVALATSSMSSTTNAWYIGWKLFALASVLVILNRRVTAWDRRVARRCRRARPWRTDVHPADPERFDDLALQRLVHRQPGDPTDHLTDEIAVREGVVGGTGADVPLGLCFGEQLRHVLPVDEVFGGIGDGAHVAWRPA